MWIVFLKLTHCDSLLGEWLKMFVECNSSQIRGKIRITRRVIPHGYSNISKRFTSNFFVISEVYSLLEEWRIVCELFKMHNTQIREKPLVAFSVNGGIVCGSLASSDWNILGWTQWAKQALILRLLVELRNHLWIIFILRWDYIGSSLNANRCKLHHVREWMGKVSTWYNWWKTTGALGEDEAPEWRWYCGFQAASICEIIVSIEETPQAYS